MSRRISALKREVIPDYKYGEKLITQFISCLMKDGKRSTAETLFYDAVNLNPLLHNHAFQCTLQSE